MDIEYEPRRWDAEAGSDEAEHRRPDFTAVHLVTFQRWVFDVTVSWSAVPAEAALSASSMVGELSVTLRDLLHTLFGGLASNAAPRRYNLRIVTDIAIVGPRTLVTAGA